MHATWPVTAGSHVVQFYDSEAFLSRAIGRFFSESARAGGPLILLGRRSLYESVVAQSGADLTARMVFVNAEDVLDFVVIDRRVHPERLEQAVASLLARADLIDREGTRWLYAETSYLLCRRGLRDTAVDLETRWNAFCGRYPIVTVCGYALESFADDAGAACFQAICDQHSHIFPTERIAGVSDERTRLARIAELEQRVRAQDSRRAPAPPIVPDLAPAPSTTVFVIDDDLSVRRALGRLLASVHLTSKTFESAEAFLDDSEIDREAGGCLIVDVQLLGMSGLELQQRLGDLRDRWPIIAMSGAFDLQVEQAALRSGAVTFLRKPFAAQALLDAIAKTR